MELWLWALIGILAVILAALLVKIHLLKKAAKEIEDGFAERLITDTNTLIVLSSNDKAMRSLADAVNVQLRKLRAQRQRYQQGDLELKNAVTNISHDLRTPLTAISGYLDLLEQAEKSEAAERYIGIIRNRTEALTQLTEELFDYSMLTVPKSDVRSEAITVNVNGVLEDSILGFYTALQERNISPEIRMPEERVLRKVNPAALSRIFSNLLNNALKYSDGDLDIVLTEEGEITFSNTASGLSGLDAERLFERFYTVETGRKSTGLGLSISRILVEQMGGAISARYEEGRLEICVLLPDSPEDIL